MNKNRTIAYRLTVGFAVLVILNAIATIVFAVTLRGIRHEIGSVATESIPSMQRINRIEVDTLQYRILTSRHVLSDDPAEMADLDRQCVELADGIQARVREFSSHADADERVLTERIEPALIAYRSVAREVRALSTQQKTKEAFALLKADGTRAYKEFEAAVRASAEYNEKAGAQDIAVADHDAGRGLNITLALGVVSLVCAVGAGWWITRVVNRSLQSMSLGLDDAATQVAAAAAQVSANSQGLAEGASEQAASLEETSSSLEELASMTRRNADHAASAKSLSAETRAAAEAGNGDMSEMRRAMDAIKGSSNDISKIIKTIDEIAFQTNILALNAAVEAARAGEAGAGFAVVADEVRALAQRSATAAKETAAKIEESIAKSDHGAAMSTKVADSLVVIVEKARKVDELVGEISTASREQSQGIGQINSAIGQMDKVTQTNAGNAEETAAAAEELNAQSATLRESVEQLHALVGGQATTRRAATPAAPAAPPLFRPSAPAAKAGTKPVPLGQPVAASTDHSDFFKDA